MPEYGNVEDALQQLWQKHVSSISDPGSDRGGADDRTRLYALKRDWVTAGRRTCYMCAFEICSQWSEPATMKFGCHLDKAEARNRFLKELTRAERARVGLVF